jgi:predicted TPR repeat methyltransferase
MVQSTLNRLIWRSIVSASHHQPDAAEFAIRFHKVSNELSQDEEFFEFRHAGETRQLRIHDYADIFGVPGLYEALVYDELQCTSPTRLADLLSITIADWPGRAGDLRVLDLGAGNGILAEELRQVGIGHIVGLDLLPEAALAAKRDRPFAYDDYIVADLTALPAEQEQRLQNARLDCLVTAAALGFGDIPPEAFAAAFNLVTTEGWLAMTIKEDFLDPQGDDSGFAHLLRSLITEGTIEIQAWQRYCHRLSIDGEQIFYLAVVARKTADIPRDYPPAHEGNGVITRRHTGPASLLHGRP